MALFPICNGKRREIFQARVLNKYNAFFRRQTLLALAEEPGLRLYSNGWFHVMTTERMNDAAFRFCTGKLARFSDAYVKLRLSSKTFDDHQHIADRPHSDTERSE